MRINFRDQPHDQMGNSGSKYQYRDDPVRHTDERFGERGQLQMKILEDLLELGDHHHHDDGEDEDGHDDDHDGIDHGPDDAPL